MRSSWVLSGGVVAALVLLGQTITLPGNGTFSAGNNDLNTTPGAASVIRRKTAGGLSAFVGTGATLPGGRTNAAVAGYNRALFAIGGSVTNSGTLTSLTDVYINIARSDGTLPGWTPVTQLPDARYGANATAYNGFLYLAGGATSAGKAATDILMAPIDPAGTSLGAWIVAGTLPQYGYVPYATNNLLYMVGWETSGNPDVYSAPISSDGTLGTFTQRTAFPTKVLSPGIAITPQALYVIGGQTPGGNTSVRTTQIGFILANGALQWVNGPQLPTARTADWVVIDGGYLYLLGQEPGETTSYAAPVLANGMLGPWISVPNAPGTACYGNAWNLGGTIYTATIGGNTCKGTTSLTAGTVGGLDTFGIGLPLGSARGGAAMASMLDTVALVGGQAASGTLSDVQWGTVSSLGVFGGFSAGPNGLPGPRSAHAAVAQHGSLYVIGGLDNNGNPLGDVLKSSFKGGSAPGAFSQEASALPSARSGVAALATDTHLYVLGGLTQTGLVNDIQVASISQGSGDLGSFAASAHTFTTARSGLAALTYNGRLYVIGGDDGTDKLGDIQYADLDPQTGALGTFSTATHALDVPRSGHAAFARDGVLYVVGGATSSTELGDTQMATFGLDGDLSAFTSAGATFTVPRHGFGAASVGQYALFAGGFGASGPVTNVSVTQTLAPSAVGVYSRLFDLGGVPGGAFDLTLDGSAVNGVLRGASLQGTTLLDFGGPITPGQTISLTPNGRTLFLQLTLDDSQSAVISGGNERDVTGLTLTYTPQAGPTKLAFSTNVQTIATNACSGAVQVQTRDATNTAIAPNNPVTVSVSASNGALLYSNPACTVALGNLSIDTSGTTSSAFYFKSAAAATITLTASASGLTTATQQEVVSAPASGGATKLEFTGVASKYKLGDTLSFSVELADESDTVITAATNTITIALSATNGATLSGTTSKSATNGVATFSLTVDREGTGYQLQAFATPALTDGTALSATFEVAAGQLAFLGTGTLGSVGVCSGPVQLQVKDPTGTSVISPSNNIPVTFSTSGGLTIYADAACSSQYTGTLVVAAGSASTPIYFIAPAAGTQSITVSAPGYGTANVDVQATTGGGGGQPDGGGGGGGTADGGSDGGDDLAAHRTINGFACSSSGAVPDLGLTLLLCAMAMLHWRRRASVTRRPAAQGRSLLGQVTIAALVLAALPARAAEPQKAAAEAQKPADAPQQPMIAVLNFNTKLQGADKAEMDIVYLAAAVRRQVLRQVHDVNMMSPESMQTLVEAAGKSLAECEGQCEVQTGRLVNADLVVSGDLLKFGSSYTLALRMHDTHSAKQIGAAETRGKDADELLAGLGAAVAELFKVILAEQSAKENAAARRDAQAQREAEARALAKAQADEQEARRKERQRSEAEDDARMRRAAEIQAQAEARAHHGGIGIFGGVVWDPKAKTMGEEAGLSLHLGLGWSAQGSAIIAPHIGGRLSLLKGLVGGEDFGLQFGLRGAVVPLPDGTAFGGGAGLRLSWYPIDHVSMFAWFAGEAYKAGTETIFAPLLSLGLQLSL